MPVPSAIKELVPAVNASVVGKVSEPDEITCAAVNVFAPRVASVLATPGSVTV